MKTVLKKPARARAPSQSVAVAQVKTASRKTQRASSQAKALRSVAPGDDTTRTSRPAPRAKSVIRYTIVPKDLAGHLFCVSVTVDTPAPDGQMFLLPAWIPGSYMIREFARNIISISASTTTGKDGQGNKSRPVSLEKMDKHSWMAGPCEGPLTLVYEVYAWDLSVRAAHLDQTHGFFNGTSVFLRVEDQEHLVHQVDVLRPEDAACKDWRVATSLPELAAPRYGFGTYQAANYDELIDHPVEMGNFELATFKAHGVPHDVVITGKVPKLDMRRLCADLKTICEAQIALFEPVSKKAPMARYVFLTLAVGDGYGGLEHRASTALICARADLPVLGQKEMSDGYRTYLGLCSHEYFHTWNVKRIKPAAFAPYELQTENYTPLLWLFEGFTSYYDDLILKRTGLIDEKDYFKLLAKTINGVLRGSGRTKQSVAASSSDAWVKYYRQDENAANAIVSYYTKGSLVALGLDLTIRAETKGRVTLDDIMRAMWQRYGRDFYLPGEEGGRGITEIEVDELFEEVSGVSLSAYFKRYVRGTEDVPLARLLKPFGVTLGQSGSVRGSGNDEAKNGRKSAGKNAATRSKPSLGVRTVKEGKNCKLAAVHEGSTAHLAGLSAGDTLVALDGLRITDSNLDGLLARYLVGDVVVLHAFRRDELMDFDVTLLADVAAQLALTTEDKPVSLARLRAAWLG